jgi:tetratricopeptide (TPR) repeat protein
VGLGITLYYAREWEEARKLFEELAKESPDDLNHRGYLGVIAARQGNREEALKHSAWLENLNRPYLLGSHTLWRARIAAVLGEQERAVLLLRDAFAQGAAYGIGFHRDPAFESLKEYGPYKELMKPKG